MRARQVLCNGWQMHAKCVTLCISLLYNARMARTKIATLNLRIDPGIKEAVREAADMEHRSVANMVEILIRRYCDEAGIVIPEQNELFSRNPHG